MSSLPLLQPQILGRPSHHARRPHERLVERVAPLRVELGQAEAGQVAVLAVHQALDQRLGAGLLVQLLQRALVAQASQLSQAVVTKPFQQGLELGWAEAGHTLDLVGRVAYRGLVDQDVLGRELAIGVFALHAVRPVDGDVRAVGVHTQQLAQVAVIRDDDGVFFGVGAEPGDDVIRLHAVLGHLNGAKLAERAEHQGLGLVELLEHLRSLRLRVLLVPLVDVLATGLAVKPLHSKHDVGWYTFEVIKCGHQRVDRVVVTPPSRVYLRAVRRQNCFWVFTCIEAGLEETAYIN